MTGPTIFDSRDTRYKDPYGAVASGTKVTLTLRPPRAEGYSWARLSARFEFRADETAEIPMPWSGLDGDRDVFTCVLDTGDYVGLVWYTFTLERLDGKKGEQLGPFQLTVYDGGEAVPAWFGEGMTYQIFPDRFRRTRVPDPNGMVGGRWVHAAWQDEPEYRPDRSGEIRNRDFFGGSLQGSGRKAGLPPQPGGAHPVLLPHLRGGGEPPLRHRRLPRHRPHAGHRGGLLPPVPKGPPAGDAGDAGRGVQPHRICEPLLQRGRLLPGAGGPPEPGLPLLLLVQLLSVARPVRELVGASTPCPP